MKTPAAAVVVRSFNIPAERVFDAWLDPTQIGRWMFGPVVREERIVRLTLDARVGGTFSFVVERQGQEIDHTGEYVEIDRPRRLVFTWGTRDSLPETSRVTIELTPVPAGCELKLTHEMSPRWAEFTERAASSWKTMLGALERALNSPTPL